METETLKNDIPLSAAVAAHSGTSWSPESRGEYEQRQYADQLANDFANLSQFADSEEKKALLDGEFARYREGYKQHTLAYLYSRSRVMSSMIAGPSKFPGARNEKRSRWAHNKLNELLEFRTRALAAITKKLRPELRPIMSGDGDATDRLEEKIAEAEALQEKYKAINAAHKAFLKDPASLDASPLSQGAKDAIRAYKPEYSWLPHPIPPFRLQNNNANIRRMKERLAQISKAQAQPEAEAKGTAATFQDCPPENRVRLTFPGKPEAEVRNTLKRGGFRWAPSLGVWQAYRNDRTIQLAKQVAGVA